jgi:hypothetical protein
MLIWSLSLSFLFAVFHFSAELNVNLTKVILMNSFLKHLNLLNFGNLSTGRNNLKFNSLESCRILQEMLKNRNYFPFSRDN